MTAQKLKNNRNITLDRLFEVLKKDYPEIKLQESDHFRWSPENNIIYFNRTGKAVIWSLLHELGHMLERHQDYTSDIGLLKMEVAAWTEARQLARKYGLKIDEKHVEKCLDSYRDWIYRRSGCPVCTQAGIERQTGLYVCINCQHKWTVTAARFCRVYRKTVTS